MATNIVSKKKPEKSLLVSLNKTGGRNSTGKITVRHRGGGSRKLYRMVDFGQQKKGVSGEVVAIEYDPNRNANIILMQYESGEKGYLLAPHGIQEGDRILCDETAPVSMGNRMKLKNIPQGTQIYNIELERDRGGIVVRGAGTSAKLLAIEEKYATVELPSSEVRKISEECYASVGTISNPEHRYKKIGKAGRSRLMGRRPQVRGSAMNPVDHPHGGGEGRSPIGLKHPKTPWGKPALGVKTRKKKWTDKLILRRRKKKKRK